MFFFAGQACGHIIVQVISRQNTQNSQLVSSLFQTHQKINNFWSLLSEYLRQSRNNCWYVDSFVSFCSYTTYLRVVHHWQSLSKVQTMIIRIRQLVVFDNQVLLLTSQDISKYQHSAMYNKTNYCTSFRPTLGYMQQPHC